MPRTKSGKREILVTAAMQHFWQHGYEATSIDDLVRATGVCRQGIYSDAGGKDVLFAKCLRAYVDAVVTPAFARVEGAHATLDTVAEFFEMQIARGEAAGLPGAGCLLANTMTEVAPRSPAIMRIVIDHNTRLRRGFARAIANTAKSAGHTLSRTDRDELSLTLIAFTNGLWAMSRTSGDATVLRRAVRQMLQLIQIRSTA